MNFSKGRFLWGLIIILLGVALTLEASGIITHGQLTDAVLPCAALIVGAFALFSYRHRFLGLILVVIGATLLIKHFTTIDSTMVFYIILIAVGIAVLGSAFGRNLWWRRPEVGQPDAYKHEYHHHHHEHQHEHSAKYDSSAREFLAIFNSIDTRLVSDDFRSTRMVAVFGSVDIDLRDTVMAGEEAFAEVVAVFGSVRLIVPPDWAVFYKGAPVFGGVDIRLNAPQTTKKLYLEGAAIFGSIDVH